MARETDGLVRRADDGGCPRAQLGQVGRSEVGRGKETGSAMTTCGTSLGVGMEPGSRSGGVGATGWHEVEHDGAQRDFRCTARSERYGFSTELEDGRLGGVEF